MATCPRTYPCILSIFCHSSDALLLVRKVGFGCYPTESSSRDWKEGLTISEAERARTSYPSFDDPNIWNRFDDSSEARTWKAAVGFYEKSLLTAAVRFSALVNDRSKVVALLAGAGWGNTEHLEEKLETRWEYIEARSATR